MPLAPTAAPVSVAKAPAKPDVQGQVPTNAGPYQWDKPLADQAYSNAVAQLANQRSQMYQQYGVSSTGAWDESNPYGAIEQNQAGGAAEGQQATAAAQHRGLAGSGLAAQMQGAAQGDYQGKLLQLLTGVQTGEQGLDYASTQAQDALNQRLFQDQLQQLQYDQSNNLYTSAKPIISDEQMAARLLAMQKAWQAAYGTGGKLGRNKAGMSYQQRVNALGSALWDPSYSYNVGGKIFGGQ